MSAPATREPLPILTSLRFFAAAEVVLYHEAYTSGRLSGASAFLRGLASGGYEAVTFFFVLSGFILAYVYSGATERDGLNAPPREFWRARFARLTPAYFLGLLIAFPHFVYSTFITKIASVPDFILGFALVPVLLQAWVPQVATAWNTPAWSLSVEALFYVCFPLLLAVTGRLSRLRFFLLAFGLVVAVAVLRHVLASPHLPEGSPGRNFELFFPLFHLPQFIFGMALGRFYLFGPRLPQRAHAAMLAAGVAGLVFVFAGRAVLPVLWTPTDVVLVLLFGLVIFGGARSGRALGPLAWRPFILLGEASYALYLLHMPLGWWWDWLTRGLKMSTPVSLSAYFALTVALSILSYLYVEKPLRRWMLGHREHRPA